MKALKIAAIAVVTVFLFTGCLPPETKGMKEEDIDFIQLKAPQDGQEIAVITTTLGEIRMVLFEKEAPNTVANFKQLIKEGFYTNKEIFLEEGVKTFVTGASDDIGAKGKVATNNGEPILCEVTQNLWHFSGAVSVLGYEKNKLSKDVLSDSRFFMVGDIEATTKLVTEMEKYKYPLKVINAYKEHGGLPQYTGAYTVFGQVIEGMDVVNQIAELKINPETKHPADGVKIEKIELSTYTAKSDDTNSKEKSDSSDSK